MWVVNFLPDFVFHVLLLIGLLGLVASFVLDSIPFVSTNAKAIQLASAVVLAIALFFEGAISDNDAWQARVKALELKVAKAETESAEANGKLSKQLAAKDKEIALAQAELKNRIKQGAAAMDAVCKIPADVVSILNDAAKKGAKK
jgi:DsbC/DsbD-like thiol-disulfide interchange protein